MERGGGEPGKKRNEVTRGILVGVGVTGLHCINVEYESTRSAEFGGMRKDEGKEAEQRVRQKWIALRLKTVFEEGDVMDWYEDEEMMGQCEEVSEEVEKIVKKTEGHGLQIEGVQRVPELMVSHVSDREKELEKRESKGKGVSWSTEKVKRGD